MNKETLDEVSFGLDLVHMAVHLGSFESTDVPAEVEQFKVDFRQIAIQKHRAETKT